MLDIINAPDFFWADASRKFYGAVKHINYVNDHKMPWGQGTCFFVKYQNTLFLLTAKHVVEDPQADYRHLHVYMRDHKGAKPLSFTAPWHYISESLDKFELDFIAFPISATSNDRDIVSEVAFDLESDVFLISKSNTDETLYTCGYSGSAHTYDDLPTVNELIFRSGIYKGVQSGVYLHSFTGNPSDKPLNGRSGSPVLLMRQGKLFLTGMLVMGSDMTGAMNFLSIEIITDFLRNIKT